MEMFQEMQKNASQAGTVANLLIGEAMTIRNQYPDRNLFERQ